MFNSLVVGTDGSATADKAVGVAADLARKVGATLHIVTAYRSSSSGMGSASGGPLVDTGAAGVLQAEAAREIAEKAGATHGGEGLTVESHAVSGHPADAILEFAESSGADLIVVGSLGMHGARRVLGSVPNSVAHGATCSVLVVKTD